MPELPEVETVARGLTLATAGKTIDRVEILRAKNIETDVAFFRDFLSGQTIEKVNRRGKYLLFHFGGRYVMVSHLRMEGKYELRKEGDPIKKHDIVLFHFTDHTYLAYNDTRKFGRLGIYRDSSILPILKLGPEPFDFVPESFFEALQKQSRPIKAVLLDQEIIAGIGNIYGDEALSLTRISPLMKSNSISFEQAKELLENIIRLLNQAIEEGGSTIRTFRSGEVDGKMQLHLRAYGKKGSPCPNCGAKFKAVTISTRTSTYCPFCQKRSDSPFVLGITGPVHSGKSTASSYFVKQGYRLFDADREIHSLYEQASVRRRIIAAFGEESYKGEKVKAVFLLSLIKNDETKKKKLESILYPLLKRHLKRFLSTLKAGDKAVLDVPLLFPSKIHEYCDATMLVLAPRKQQADRLQSEGKDPDSYLALNADYPLEEAKKKADVIVFNDEDLPSFYAKLRLFQ